MQDEPELGLGFSRKMSLNGDGGMLSIDHQNGRFSDDEHRANPGVGGRQQRRAFYRAATWGEIRVSGARSSSQQEEGFLWKKRRTVARDRWSSGGRKRDDNFR